MNGLVAYFGQREVDTSIVLPEANCRGRPSVFLKYVSKVCSTLASVQCLLLELLELCHAACDSKIGRALAPVAGCVCESEVVFVVQPLLGQRDDVVQFDDVKDRIDGIVTDEAPARLAVEKTGLKCVAVRRGQTREDSGNEWP